MRKKIVVILLCLLISSMVIAQEDITEFNYDQLNSLSGEDVALALQQGANPALINDFQLAEAVRSDITIVALLQDQDLTRVINQEISNPQNSQILVQLKNADLMRALNYETRLLDNEQVISTFEGRLEGDEGIFFIDQVNDPDNSEVRVGWFSHYGITAHKRAAIIGFAGETITTGDIGDEGVTIAARFEMSKFPGATLNGKGELILPDESVVHGYSVAKVEGSEQIVFQKLYSTKEGTVGSHLLTVRDDLNEKEDYAFIEGGIIANGKERIEFLGAGTYQRDSDSLTVSGEGQGVVFKRVGGRYDVEVLRQVVGMATFYDNGKVLLEKNTNLHEFTHGVIYQVRESTELFSEKGSCNQISTSCVEYIQDEVQGGEMNIKARESNEIRVTITTLDIEKGIKSLNVETINDESTVTINDQNQVLLEFSDEPVKIKGQPAAMTIQSLTYSFEEETASGKIREMNYEINRGRIRGCQETQCKEVGMIRSERLDLTAEEILQYSTMWAVRTAGDKRYIGEWGGKGEVIYASSYGNDVRRIAECGNNPRCKMPSEEYYTKIGKDQVKAAYDCVGFQGEAIYQATGRGFKYDLSTEGSKTNRDLAQREEGFEQVLYFVGTEERLQQVLQEAKKDEIAAPLEQEIREGKVIVRLFENSQSRAEALREVPAGAPVSQLDEDDLRDVHSILKGFGTDSFESHVGSREISVDIGKFEYATDRPLLVTQPKKEQVAAQEN